MIYLTAFYQSDTLGYIGSAPASNECGLDRRLMRIYEAAPLYYINKQITENKLEFLILVANNDVRNRLEKTLLMKTMMIDFSYSEDDIE